MGNRALNAIVAAVLVLGSATHVAAQYTSTPNLALKKPTVSTTRLPLTDPNNWGNLTNANWDLVDSILYGAQGIVPQLKSYTIAAGPNQLPVAGTAGRLARVTDGCRGGYRDFGTFWGGDCADPRDFGLSTAASAATNATAMTDAFAASAHVKMPCSGTYAVNTFTVPYGKTLSFCQGGLFAPAANQMIRVEGFIDAGPYKIVSSTDITEAGSPLRFMGSVNHSQQMTAHVNWWGAVPDGKSRDSWTDTVFDGHTNNSVPLQQALRAIANMPSSPTKAASAPRLLFGPGCYDYNTALVMAPTSSTSMYGFVLEGAVGTKSDTPSPDTSAQMQTCLHYVGTGVGLTIGADSPRQSAYGAVIKHLWFGGTVNATTMIRAWMTASTFEDVMFTNTGDSGSEGALRLTCYSCSLNRVSFVKNWDGMWCDGCTATTIKESIFLQNVGTYALAPIGLNMVVSGNTFQDNTSDAIGIDLAASYGASENAAVIEKNYFEAKSGTAWSGATAYVVGNVVTSGGNDYTCILNHTNQVPPNATYWTLYGPSRLNRVVLRGQTTGGNPSANPVRGTVLRDNYFASVGTLATAYIFLQSTDGVKFSGNSIPRNQATVGIQPAFGSTTRNVNLFVPAESTFYHPIGNYTAPTDANEASRIITNRGASGAMTLTLPRCVPGMRMTIYKVDADPLTIARGGTDDINGAASIANTTTETTATITLQCWDDNGTTANWIVESKIGTWG